MVPITRFENVCEELNIALKREQQAQALLHEQTAQRERLELHANQGEEKDVTLAEAVKVLVRLITNQVNNNVSIWFTSDYEDLWRWRLLGMSNKFSVSVTNNSTFWDYSHPNGRTRQTTETLGSNHLLRFLVIVVKPKLNYSFLANHNKRRLNRMYQQARESMQPLASAGKH